MKILDISPPEAELTLAAITQQKVTISPQLIGSLPAGLKIQNIRLIPNEVQVLAPPPQGDAKGPSLSTTPIFLSSINTDSRILCKIIAPPSFQPVDRRWPDIEVILSLENATGTSHE